MRWEYEHKGSLFTPSMIWKALGHAIRAALWPNAEYERARREPLQKADPVTRAYVSRHLKSFEPAPREEVSRPAPRPRRLDDPRESALTR